MRPHNDPAIKALSSKIERATTYDGIFSKNYFSTPNVKSITIIAPSYRPMLSA